MRKYCKILIVWLLFVYLQMLIFNKSSINFQLKKKELLDPTQRYSSPFPYLTSIPKKKKLLAAKGSGGHIPNPNSLPSIYVFPVLIYF